MANARVMARLSAMRYDITEKKRLLHRVAMFVAFLGCEIVSGTALTCDACGQGSRTRSPVTDMQMAAAAAAAAEAAAGKSAPRVEQTRQQLMGSDAAAAAFRLDASDTL